MRQRSVTLGVSIAAVGAIVAAIPSATATADARAVIPQSHPAWAVPQAKVAESAADAPVTFRVYLNHRDAAGAEATAAAVSDPANRSYRAYLTPAQVRDRFAATDSAVNDVRNWLSGNGIKVGDVPANRAYVEATGSTGQVERAFAVDLSRYAVRGQSLRAADKDLSVPAALGREVLGVIGVDQATALLKPNHTTGADPVATPAARTRSAPATVPPGPGFRNSGPCSQYYGQKVDRTDPAYGGVQRPYAPCGYVPDQLRSAYGVDKARSDGRGATVAIIDAFASPTIYQDASTYAKRNDPGHPLRQSQFAQYVFPTNGDLEGPDGCDAAGWYGEETLDVEAVHAMAPGANILYVGGRDCLDTSLDEALNYVVAGHKADIISNSYGDLGEDIPADEVKAFNQIAVQAALEGIGVYFSSGDSGDDAAVLGYPSPDFSASSPWVTAVGGTSLAVGRNGKRLFETGWETGKGTLTGGTYAPPFPGAFTSGSGGGTSRLFTQPFYQRGIVPDALSRQNQTGATKGRVVPDIAAVGDPNTGFLVGQTQTFSDGVYYDQYRIGGTSLAAPVLAGIMAVSDSVTGFHHGFINPVIYAFTSRTGAISDVRHVDAAVQRVDFVNGENAADGVTVSGRTLDYQGLTIHTTPGYDNVTGLGSPNGLAFLYLS